MKMKTKPCRLIAYCETTGGPVCISTIAVAAKWHGTEQEDSLYWDVVNHIGKNLLFKYSEDYTFFNSETGNFAFFKSDDSLVIAEIITIEEKAAMPWNGIVFDIEPHTQETFNLKGLTCFFDSALSIQDKILPQESLNDIRQGYVWDTAILDCEYSKTCEVLFKSVTMHLQGVCFLKE
ncbi:hypothetical protein ACVWYF_000728 [Hymenobacter sp. UYAg731]